MRRAITLETVTNPASISDSELDSLVNDLSDEIQSVFPDDQDAGALSYGMLMHGFRRGWEVPEELENDQIEDWIVGRAVLMVVRSQEQRSRVYQYLESKLALTSGTNI